MSQRTALAIRHVAFEDLGTFATALARAGFTIAYREADDPDLAELDPLGPDLLVVLGGPLGVNDGARYPCIGIELSLLERRLSAGLPTLGICLGAQLIARALGARVYPALEREIGWRPITLADDGARGPLASLADVAVLHWHGDTFDLPAGARVLASTPTCPHQAFAIGAHVLALQFHAEASDIGFERWLIGHASELATAGIDPVALRADAKTHGTRLQTAADALMTEWLDQAWSRSPTA